MHMHLNDEEVQIVVDALEAYRATLIDSLSLDKENGIDDALVKEDEKTLKIANQIEERIRVLYMQNRGQLKNGE